IAFSVRRRGGCGVVGSTGDERAIAAGNLAIRVAGVLKINGVWPALTAAGKLSGYSQYHCAVLLASSLRNQYQRRTECIRIDTANFTVNAKMRIYHQNLELHGALIVRRC